MLRRRRMVRHYTDQPVSPAEVDALVGAGLRAPSAGFTQGFRLLVLTDAADRERLWEATDWLPPDPQRDRMAGEMRAAPLVIVPLCSEPAYRDRYAEADKAWIPEEDIWAVPYWYVDAGFAAMLMLLKAVDLGLGAVFIGATPRFIPRFREAFGVPDAFVPIGLVLVGHRHPDVGPAYRSERRRPVEEMVHRGGWEGR